MPRPGSVLARRSPPGLSYRRRPGRESQGSCVKHSREEEAILILCKVIDKCILVRRQRTRSSEHVVFGSLPGHPLGDWLEGLLTGPRGRRLCWSLLDAGNHPGWTLSGAGP
jgi:hypothetical protein